MTASSTPALPFIHLRAHSAYSLSEGAIPVKALVKFAAKHQMPAIGITDTNNLFGSLEFSKEAMGAGIQPIIGCLLNFKAVDGEAFSTSHKSGAPDKLLLIAQNEVGYHHLLWLASEAYLHPAADEAPLLAYKQLEGHTDGLICLTGGVDGMVGRLIADGLKDQAAYALEYLQKQFGNRLYIELHRHGLAVERQVEPQLLRFALEYQVPVVATADAYFIDPAMYEAHDALLCIADGRYVQEENRRKLTPQHRLKTPQEMVELFADIPEAIANTAVIARRCSYASPSRDPILPRFVDGGEDAEAEEFARIAKEGLRWRLDTYVFPDPNMPATEREEQEKPYWERLEFEIGIIQRMKFPGYFLIVSDFIRWAKEHDVPVGPGRGSGAGSLVAWAMKITDLDPLRYSLLFERFLNPERVSMPDFDVDFCQDRRELVIQYVQQRYGRERVAQIITFGKLQARAVIRDVGRVLQMSYGAVDRISKLIPNNPANPVTLSEAIDLEPLLQQAIKEDHEVARLVGIGKQLEGLYRHASTHAAGVVIGDRPLHELVPMYRDPKSDMPVIQYSMKYAETAGLVKFDFLGLKTLTVLKWACRVVQETTGDALDLLKLPLEDAKTYELLGQGKAMGVFQLESSGMRDTLIKLKPTTLEDIIALVSLYRPGPMDNIPTYINRKHGKERPDYLHPLLEPILQETFGIFIYQEQVMQVAQVMGGYSLGQADLLRRAMGKKIKEEMDQQRDIFMKGALEKGVKESKAREVFDLMAKFASYGFNKSHAAAYALIAFQTAYLKANYPVQFFIGLMALDSGNTEKLNLYKQDAERMGIRTLPPDINASEANFCVEKLEDGSLAIRYALGALKNVGMSAMEAVVEERKNHGRFDSLADFARRMDNRVMNRRTLEFLVKAGVFDSLHPNRRQLFECLDMLLAISDMANREKNSNQIGLFGEELMAGAASTSAALEFPPMTEWPMNQKLGHEFDAIGFYVSAHPLQAYEEALHALRVTTCSKFEEVLGEKYAPINVAGVVVSLKSKVSAKGKYAFLALSDPDGTFEVSVFDEEILRTQWNNLQEGNRLLISADGKLDDTGARIMLRSVQTLDDAVRRAGSSITRAQSIRLVANKQLDVKQLKQHLASARHRKDGKPNLRLALQLEETLAMVELPGSYHLSPMDVMELEACAGMTKVSVES